MSVGVTCGVGAQSGTLVNAILFHCGLPAVRLVEGGRAEGGLLSGRSTEARTGGSDEVVGSESGEQQQQQQHDENDDDDDDDDDASVRLLLAGEDTSRSSSMERSSQDPVIRPGIVHRLDKGTSGLLVIAKDDITHRGLCEQVRAHPYATQFAVSVMNMGAVGATMTCVRAGLTL
jgi:23S rRNA pseudouridine1911/1915/1917 synthase